jgi:dipeptidyl aminopeptidase/acylaminoacyl peptidase
MQEQVAGRLWSISARFAQHLRVLMIGALCAANFGIFAAEQRPFTIKDSIELSYFVRPVLWSVNQEPSTEPVVSPDGKQILVITQKGILAKNKIQSSIWILERQAIKDFGEKTSRARPQPRMIASFMAAANTPIISDVRWLDDSARVAFLARVDDGTSQLFISNAVTGKIRQMTHARQSVSAYDVRGQTIAYTTLDDTSTVPAGGEDLADVTGKNLFTLLWSNRPNRERDESLLLTVPNTLHIVSHGRELQLDLQFEGKPLKLFFPILSLSPNEKFLITVAPVTHIPAQWKEYQPRFGYEDLRIDPGNKWVIAPENAWRPSQFVKIDLHSGLVTPLIDAPAGRSLFQIFAPTKALWSPDSRTVLLCNTFLPLTREDRQENALRSAAPAAVTLDVSEPEDARAITYFPQPNRGDHPIRHVEDVDWSTAKNEVTLRFASSPDNVPVSHRESYRLNQAGWVEYTNASANDLGLSVSVYQDLNRAPVLMGGRTGSSDVSLIWDPNPQLSDIALGKASLYTWLDKDNQRRSGILVVPPHYLPGKRYPLVIQTHGFESNKFFADGIYTTGSGGRALGGRGMIVLQTEQYSKSDNPRHDAEVEMEAFRSGIQHLSTDGFIDPKRVGIIGFSFTVYHTLYALTHYPDLFATASITDGNDLSYWLYLMWTDIPFAQQMAETANGGVKPFGKEGLLKWQESAPGFRLDQVQAPLLISCLEEGTLIGSWDIYGGLRTLGKPVDLLWLRDEDAPHVLVQPRQRYLSQETAVDWFDFWLNHHEDPSPEKISKYVRWRELRRAVSSDRESDRSGNKESQNGPSS